MCTFTVFFFHYASDLLCTGTLKPIIPHSFIVAPASLNSPLLRQGVRGCSQIHFSPSLPLMTHGNTIFLSSRLSLQRHSQIPATSFLVLFLPFLPLFLPFLCHPSVLTYLTRCSVTPILVLLPLSSPSSFYFFLLFPSFTLYSFSFIISFVLLSYFSPCVTAAALLHSFSF